MRQFAVDTDAAGVAAFNLGENVKKALAVPASISIREFAEGSLNEARGAIVALAKDLGGLDQVPTKILDQFNQIKTFAEGLSPDAIDWYQNLQKVDVQARGLAETLRKLAEGRKRDADAAKAAADASSKLAEETRKRVAELSTQGLSGAEQARLKADNDRLAILDEERNARAALAQAERQFDIAGILAAEERLRLAQAARQTVQQQARDQRLQELGVDQKILKPAASVADQFKAVRQAFNEKLIDGGEAREALRNLAAEGIEIRRNIDAELRRPANRALEVSDIRSQQGIAQFLGLATGREDPAIAQQREQLAKLEEIRRALIAIGANPVDILGA
jgi:vacuolar-type H+-ATPase subunit I/STV1